MSSSTLPGFPVTQALSTGGTGTDTVANHSSKYSQAIDSKDYRSGFYRELSSALSAASGARNTPSKPLSNAVDELLSGSDLPQDGNGLPVPMLPQTEPGGPAPAGFGFVWLTDSAIAADPVVADATLEARLDPALPAVAEPSMTSPELPVGAVQFGASQAGASEGTAGSAGSGSTMQGAAATAPATLSATGSASLGAASMSGVTAGGVAPTGGGAIGSAAVPAVLDADGPGVGALATPVLTDAGAGSAAVLTAEAATATPVLPGTPQPFVAQHSVQAGLPVGTPLAPGGPDWSDALAQRIGWMLEGQLGRAEIAIDPPELGPLQVRITTLHDHTQVQFLSQHAAVRDALDQALPRLREMLEAQGLQLAHADVSDQRQSDDRRHSAGTSMGQGGNAEASPALDHPRPVMTVGLIDAYA